MNDRPGAGPERRTDARIAAKGALTIRALDYEQHARIVNIGVGGAYVQTSVKAPDRLLARKVDLEVRFDAGHQEWWRATGRVLRINADGIGVAFDTLAPALLRSLDELSTAARAHRRVVNVVLIDTDPQRRGAMAAGFRSTGCAVVEAASSLEAIVRLGEASFEPDVIAIADSDPALEATNMRVFVERDHPRVKVVTIGDQLLQPDGFANWLSSSNPDADLPARVRDVLVAPRRPLQMTNEQRAEKGSDVDVP